MKTFITYIIALILPLPVFSQTIIGTGAALFGSEFFDNKEKSEEAAGDEEETSQYEPTGLTNFTKREFRLGVINLLEEYEKQLNKNSKEGKYYFERLFEDDNLRIYNDLFWVTTDKTITVADYVDTWFDDIESATVTIKEVRVGELYEDETHIMVDATFDKSVWYVSKCGIIFDSKEFYKSDYNITATVVMDKTTKRISFRSIKGTINSNTPPLPLYYNVYEYNTADSRDKKITADNVKLVYNSYGQAFVDAKAKMDYNDPDVSLRIINKNGCNLYRFEYKKHRWRIKPKAELSVGNLYDFGRDEVNDMIDTELMYDFGLDIGYALVAAPRFKLGLFTGAGVSKSIVNFETKNLFRYSYEAEAKADYDGDSYIRNYEVAKMKAKMDLLQLYVPLYLDFDFRVSRNFTIYLQGGAKAYYTQEYKITDIQADLYTYGVYPQYGNLKIEDFAPNNFGNNSYKFDEQKVIGAEEFVFDVFGGLGFRWRMFGNLYLDAGVTYQTNITPIYETDMHVSFAGEPDERYAMFTYTCQDGEKIKPLYNSFTGVTRKAIKPGIGLLLKF